MSRNITNSNNNRKMNPSKFYRTSGHQTLSNVIDLASEDLPPDNKKSKAIIIPILPPDNATENVTDQDSGEDDGPGTIDNLPGSILCSESALNFSPCVSKSESPQRKKKKKSLQNRKWTKRDIKSDFPNWSIEDIQKQELSSKHLTPSQYFELFFDEMLINLTVVETNKYAFQNNVSLNVSNDEMKCFLGILLLSGYQCNPRRRMYWESASDTHHPLVSKAMRRDRFESIFTHLHFADNNNLNTNDKFAKIRPLVDYLNEKFIHYAPLEEFYSFDESMCEYFGKHGCKQFIRGKPIHFGYKIWCGTTTLGYVVWFEPYQGKGIINSELGLGGELVMRFTDVLLNHNPLSYHLCFGHFFTSVKLMSLLKEKSIKATGTIRESRKEKCPLLKKEDMKKNSRGCFDYRTDANNEILICTWNDNNVVSICSNAIGIEPVGQASRYSLSSKKRFEIQQPYLLKIYNARMGGVDRMDQNILKYRISIRGKKWYSSLVTYMIDVAMNNAWQLHKICLGSDAMDLLSFRRSVVRFYLERYCNTSQQGQKKIAKKTDNCKFDKYAHWVIPQEKQTRCAYCHTKTTTRCEKCDKGLHVKCFKSYHLE